MKGQFGRRLAILVTVVLVGVSPARADWTFSWSLQPQQPYNSGTGSVAFALDPGGPGGPVIPAATITTNSVADGFKIPPDSYNVQYSLTLTINDTAANLKGTAIFLGALKGTLTATTSTLVNTFSDTPSNPLTQTVPIGAHDFVVTIDPTTTQIQPPSHNDSPILLDALVQVNDHKLPPPVQNVPEPSGYVLCGGALAVLALTAHRLRRRVAVFAGA
jgi:hypothetical protein